MWKDNWNEVRDRYTAWWKNEPVDHPPVIFDIIGELRHPMYNRGDYDYQKYGDDVTRFCADFEAVWKKRSACRDDAIPCLAPQMGGIIEAAFWAGEIDWGREVTSLVPHNPLAQGEGIWNIQFNLDNRYYQRVLRELGIMTGRSRGRYGVNFEASVAITTTISQLRGGTQFMYDTADHPERLRQIGERILEVLLRVQAEVERLNPLAEGTAHRWLNYWNPGRGFWFSEDDAIMLSPGAYWDIFMDLDRRLCAATDYAAIHWHMGGMHLLDALLDIENLRVIQLSFDPNGPDFEHVLADCRRIAETGRKICFQMGFDENRLRAIFAALDPNACLFYFPAPIMSAMRI